MKKSTILMAALLFSPLQPIFADTPAVSASTQTAQHAFPAAAQQHVVQATTLLHQGKAEQALPLLNQAVAETERALQAFQPKRVVVSGDPHHVLQLLLQAAERKESTIALSEEWIVPFYLRGFAYIELKQLDNAKRDLDTALKLAPLHPRILGERGQLSLMEKNWTEAEQYFKQQQVAAKTMKQSNKAIEYQGFALRGLGYIAVERQQWDTAERHYREALALNRNDRKSMSELLFVLENKQKK